MTNAQPRNFREYKPLYTPFRIIREIGSGAFGKVTLVKETDGQKRELALKKVTCSTNEELSGSMEEITSLVRTNHLNIVKMLEFGVYQEQPHQAIFSLLLEFCPNGTLNHRFRKSSSKSTNIRWMSEISSAITYLHSINIIHQDLKPDNVLLADSDQIKIADFGLAVRFSRRNDFRSAEAYYIHNGVGAMAYVAPEMFNDRHTYKVDIFGMGIIFHAILERAYHDFGQDRCYGAFVDKEPLGKAMFVKKGEIPVPFRRRRLRLVKRMLKYHPADRPSAEEVHRVVTNRFLRLRQLNIIPLF